MDFKGTGCEPDKENKYKYYKKLFLMASYQLAGGFSSTKDHHLNVFLSNHCKPKLFVILIEG